MARGFEVLDVGENLNDLTGILRGETVDEGLADLVAEEIVERSAERFVDDGRFLEVIIREEVNLVEEVSYVDAAKWVHLGEGQDAGKSKLWSVYPNDSRKR